MLQVLFTFYPIILWGTLTAMVYFLDKCLNLKCVCALEWLFNIVIFIVDINGFWHF